MLSTATGGRRPSWQSNGKYTAFPNRLRSAKDAGMPVASYTTQGSRLVRKFNVFVSIYKKTTLYKEGCGLGIYEIESAGVN